MRLRKLTHGLKLDALVLWVAARDRRTPWSARVLAGLAAGYILSPVQLIPNFIPVVGYVDDLLVVTVGGWLALKLIPAALIEEFRVRAQAIHEQPASRTAAAVIIILWMGLAAFIGAVAWPLIVANPPAARNSIETARPRRAEDGFVCPSVKRITQPLPSLLVRLIIDPKPQFHSRETGWGYGLSAVK